MEDFAVDAVTGELSVAQELAGAAREQPYELVVVAEDAGDPSLSSSVRIKLKVSEALTQKEGEKGQVIFISPPVEYVLKIKEVKMSPSLARSDGSKMRKGIIPELQDTPINEHIYNVKARLAGMGEERMNIKYSLKYFDIDESSGEVYVTKALDFESTKYHSGYFIKELKSCEVTFFAKG
ncbi:hypothetical protein ANCCAN_26442 [Ancylostoma caninum]|uniref:Cadherin domain-containing protein n=1 Tax=Ancylostoma caninum TaxID=29170 RepID=A0A368F6Q2_ANCCA|nr:hypothetical protein ANCCAN_26442 [Ancylostoma caninum]